MLVDSDHAGDKDFCRSRSGFLIYVITALMQWILKKQYTVETSVFCTEFVVMKQSIDALRGLRYNLRMMGIPIFSLSYNYGDNMSVVHNTSRPGSVLRKKSNSVCYHTVHESVAMGESHILNKENDADLIKKALCGQKRKYLVSKNLYYICYHHWISVKLGKTATRQA